MKTKVTSALAVFCWLPGIIASAADMPLNNGPVALSVVLDTAWSNERELSDYRSLARQGIAILQPGDYVEIITGHPGKPILRVAQFIKAGDAQEVSSITAPINKVSCPFLSDVDISKAVDMAIQRLIQSDAKNSFRQATVIVFSDGRLNDRDVRRLQELSRQFRQRNWSLCVTGTDRANRKLLIAANQGDLKFSLISAASPALWLRTQKELSAADPSVAQSASLVSVNPENESAKPRSRVNIETTVSITDGAEMKPQAPPPPAAEIMTPKPEPNQPAAAVTKSIAARPEPIKKEPAPKPQPARKPFPLSKKLLWLIPITMVGGLAVLLIAGLVRAHRTTGGIGSDLPTTPAKDPGMVIAKLNGQAHTLGREDRLGTIHFGSGQNNTIRVPDKSLSERHVKIFRNRRGLLLQNIGKTPITVNSAALKPKGRQTLTLPSIIEFDGKHRIELTLVKPKPPYRPTDKENQNGTGQ